MSITCHHQMCACQQRAENMTSQPASQAATEFVDRNNPFDVLGRVDTGTIPSSHPRRQRSVPGAFGNSTTNKNGGGDDTPEVTPMPTSALHTSKQPSSCFDNVLAGHFKRFICFVMMRSCRHLQHSVFGSSVSQTRQLHLLRCAQLADKCCFPCFRKRRRILRQILVCTEIMHLLKDNIIFVSSDLKFFASRRGVA